MPPLMPAISTRTRAVFACLLFVLASPAGAASSAGGRADRAEGPRRPNVVIILADDLGYGDLGCYGNEEMRTPHVDQLAAEGMRFTDFHSSGTVCSPTRAGLLTGRYQQRAGIPGVVYADPDRNRHHGLQPGEITLAERLHQAGYATGLVGKWHLGYRRKYNPTRQGFDRFVGFVSGNVGYRSHVDGFGYFDWWGGLKKNHESGYSTHLITEHAVDFIEDHREGPFFLYVAHEAPHRPYQAPGDPPIREEGNPDRLWNDREPSHARAAYPKMVREMDRGVGRILRTLDRLGLSRDTLVLFLSDNGPIGPGSAGPLRGRKATVWEGGHRVPAIARWPGKIEAGAVRDQLAISIDLMPTVLDLTGVSPPEGRKLDGVSLRPVLLRDEPLKERTLFWDWSRRGTRAVRRGSWKLVLEERGLDQPALFHLSEDLDESNDLAVEHPRRVRRMTEAFAAWKKEMDRTATRQPRAAADETGEER